jgi:hypothetical protein
MPTLTSLGDAGTVTNSSHLFNADKTRALVDCGLPSLQSTRWRDHRIDNRRLSRLIKLAGAPTPGSRSAQERAPRRSLHAASRCRRVHAKLPGELAYALDFARRGTPIIGLDTD